MAGDAETATWSSQEVAAVGERIAGTLRGLFMGTLDELIAILGEQRGFLRIARSVKEQTGSITIASSGDVATYC